MIDAMDDIDDIFDVGNDLFVTDDGNDSSESVHSSGNYMTE